MADRFSSRSNAMRGSLMMTMVWPKIVIELMGPVIDSLARHRKRSNRKFQDRDRKPIEREKGYGCRRLKRTIELLEPQPMFPILLSWRRQIPYIANDRFRLGAWRKRRCRFPGKCDQPDQRQGYEAQNGTVQSGQGHGGRQGGEI